MGPFVFTFVFPTLTIFLLVFHLFIACFMAMKYWCDRRRLYLVPIAWPLPAQRYWWWGLCPASRLWLDLYQFNVANYNDAMIFYMFRHFLMAVLIIISALLYTLRTSALSRSTHIGIVVGASLFTGSMLGLALFYSSHSTLLTLDTVDNETRQFMVLWSGRLISFWSSCG